jgi:ferritin-like metal-binding protein YciE
MTFMPKRKTNDMKLNTLRDLFVHELKDLHSAETQILKALPKMVRAATHEDLKDAFKEHLQQTKHHVTRLEEIAAECECKLTGHTCRAMKSLIEEGAVLISEEAEDHVRDAGLIVAAQRIAHHEIAAYCTARALAKCLDHGKAMDLLEESLEDEKEADERLTEIAESVINVEAAEV